MTKIEAINKLILSGIAIPLAVNNNSNILIQAESNISFDSPLSLPLPIYSLIMLAPSQFNKNNLQNS